MTVPVIHSPRYACDIGAHVFPIAKFGLVLARLAAEGQVAAGGAIEPGLPSRELLERVHTRALLDDLEGLRWTERTSPSELPLTAGIVTAYQLAAEGTTLAARVALDHGGAIHLGGGYHHASADRAEGFCYLNDLAIAVRALQAEGRVRRAAVVDLDVHQGNGTALIFAGDPDVFTLSVHQESNYPTPKPPSTLDVGLADGIQDDEYLLRLDQALERVWEAAPEIVLYQAGADPFEDDQLGGLKLTLAGLEERDRRVLDGCAARGIPAVVTLGGGYARRIEDTVAIHAATCRVAIAAVAMARAPVATAASPSPRAAQGGSA